MLWPRVPQFALHTGPFWFPRRCGLISEKDSRLKIGLSEAMWTHLQKGLQIKDWAQPIGGYEFRGPWFFRSKQHRRGGKCVSVCRLWLKLEAEKKWVKEGKKKMGRKQRWSGHQSNPSLTSRLLASKILISLRYCVFLAIFLDLSNFHFPSKFPMPSCFFTESHNSGIQVCVCVYIAYHCRYMFIHCINFFCCDGFFLFSYFCYYQWIIWCSATHLRCKHRLGYIS